MNNIKHLLDFHHSLSTETGSGLIFLYVPLYLVQYPRCRRFIIIIITTY